MAWAYTLIKAGEIDIAIAGGAEACIHQLPVAGFSQMRAMSTRNDDPTTASRPFDIGRDGFVLGEGAGMMVLERRDHAVARGAEIYGTLAGIGMSNDAFHITAPEPDGEGGSRAIAKALRSAGLSKTDIGHVNAHATSTPVGDIAESNTIRRAIGDHPVVTATKSMTGHMLGASGAVEAIATLLAVKNGIVPGTQQHLRPRSRRSRSTWPPRPARSSSPPRSTTPSDSAATTWRWCSPSRPLVVVKSHRRSDRPPGDAGIDPSTRPAHLGHVGMSGVTVTTTADHPAPAAGPAQAGLPRAGDPVGQAARPRHRRRAARAPTPPGSRRCAAGSTAPRSIAYCTDATRMGGAMGSAGCRHIVDAIDAAIRERIPVDRDLALRRRPAGRGRRGAGRRRAGVRGDGPRVRAGAADLGGARAGRRRRGLRAGADRHRHHGAGRPDLRHRAGRGALGDRRGGRHGGARRPVAHGRKSGVVHIVSDSEDDAYVRARRVSSLFSRPGHRRCGRHGRRPRAGAVLPEQRNRAYNVQPLIDRILDEPMEELQARWAPNIVIGLGRLAGRTRRRGRQQPAAPGRLPGLHLGGEGLPVRADVRRLRHPAAGASSTCPATCRASARSGTAWSAAAPSCCTPSPRPWCRG